MTCSDLIPDPLMKCSLPKVRHSQFELFSSPSRTPLSTLCNSFSAFTFFPPVFSLKFTARDGSLFIHDFINLKSKFETCEFWVVLWCFTVIHTLYIDIVLPIQNSFNLSYSCSCSPLICMISEFLFTVWFWYFFFPLLLHILPLHYWFSFLFLRCLLFLLVCIFSPFLNLSAFVYFSTYLIKNLSLKPFYLESSQSKKKKQARIGSVLGEI